MEPTSFPDQQRKLQTGRWSKEQHERFMLGLMQHGKDWKKVQDVVGTRSGSQVRSHAQKFFNKIQKGNHKSMTQNEKRIQEVAQQADEDVSFTENNEALGRLNQLDHESMATPVQLISLIKRQSMNNNNQVNLNSFKRSLQTQQRNQQKIRLQQLQEEQGDDMPEVPFELNSYKSMKNIINAYENLQENRKEQIQFQDQSFLIGLTRKYKKYFSKGGRFQSLIDFGGTQGKGLDGKVSELYPSIRKKSWTLVQGYDGNEEDLEDIKKKIKDAKTQKKQLKQIRQQNQCQRNVQNKQIAQFQNLGSALNRQVPVKEKSTQKKEPYDNNLITPSAEIQKQEQSQIKCKKSSQQIEK